MLRIIPFSLAGAGLLVVGGAIGGTTQWILWTLAAALLWVTPWLTTTEGFVVTAEHFVERHGLVGIVALGESVVVIGAGAAGLELDAGLLLVALLSLALSAALWWTYFSDEGAVERAMVAVLTGAAGGAGAVRVRVLALRPSARRRRFRGRAQEGDRRPLRPARRLDRVRAGGGRRTVPGVRRRLPAHIGRPARRDQAGGSGRSARDDPDRHRASRGTSGGSSGGDPRRRACSRCSRPVRAGSR